MHGCIEVGCIEAFTPGSNPFIALTPCVFFCAKKYRTGDDGNFLIKNSTKLDEMQHNSHINNAVSAISIQSEINQAEINQAEINQAEINQAESAYTVLAFLGHGALRCILMCIGSGLTIFRKLTF
ncbi:hypothetical protein [Egbenema bharatensis]|uniref:hypothetical protein n=1 Tax=Egbenema bharatensis TaxID=3463334 RepID=UPI003A852B54